MNNKMQFSSLSEVFDSYKTEDISFHLDIGEPKFNLEEILSGQLINISNIVLKYGPIHGMLELREVLREKIYMQDRISYPVEGITITNGATSALQSVLYSLIKPMDSVLIPLPNWPSYSNFIKSCNGNIVNCQIEFTETHIYLDIKLIKYLSYKWHIKCIIITNPHNPIGRFYDKNNLQEIIEFCISKGINIVIDEAYYGLDHEASNFGFYLKHPNVFFIRSFSKYYLAPGIRLGYVFGNPNKIQYVGAIHNALHGKVSILSQEIGNALLKQDDFMFKLQLQKYKDNVKMIERMFRSKSSLIEIIKPNGAFFLWCEIKPRIDMKKFYYKLAKIYKTLVVPGFCFGGGFMKFIRISLTEDSLQLYNGVKNLIECIGDSIE